MKIGIIAVGSELLLGQINNTNGQYLSQLFNEAGHSVIEHAVIGDNPERLERVVRQMLNHYEAVVLTGGLGPTKDDLTKHTVAKILGKELVIDEKALNYIESYFKEQHQEMTPNNRQQALVIEGSKVLENKVGMAPGIYVEHEGKHVVMLPGPPIENRPMAKNELLPLMTESEQIIYSEMLKFAGIGESRVETELMDLIESQHNPTIAPLAGSHEVKVRLTANGKNQQVCQKKIDPIKTSILERIGKYYYASDEVEIEEAVMNQFHSSFAIYDGVTEGLLYSRMKNYDSNSILKGMLTNSSVFVDNNMEIKAKLKISAELVSRLYNTQVGISVLEERENVYLGILENHELACYTFKMTKKRNLIKTRTPNYTLIRILEWLRS
ncbi:CinA family nicotinamide mononucleotide deamidase-related protein [Staphylococcus sp. SQ8-PEA]|uniref:Putative competence-damage inducible protein n=1 Tax=Staphylococcus marylandisciuri TaxID=2981529 RepID=A0ABT2QS08_9STAP|nr:CinA family nicotinamide mononucleotide deamidase-related protein [Staphylococcus marylandisciuri]MCU5746764.1 CinA family nicotinamide mononucleotide deamidase-related protein [Staphylococcus marylandisciuri]